MRRLAAPLLLPLLAGCAGMPLISHSSLDLGYIPGEWRGNDVPVVVRGAPFAVPQGVVDAAVVANLQGVTFGVPTRFVPAPAGAMTAYRVVMVFDPAPGAGEAQICARPEPPSPLLGTPPASSAEGRRVRTIAALCRGDKAISFAEGTIATGAAPSSGEFRNGVVAFGQTLFPPNNPELNGGPDFPG